ncbi:iron-sulfur cluster assembly protein [Luteitalea sp.]|jgi:FeS assembly SUF system protein|uniref:iron-sulfur cluster assembly protein n=1 Tax=Luteitalea sp. TaxID=2004800 RepID=UPI0037C785C8
MFSFLKSKSEPEPAPENPLAAPVETPDVPRPKEQSGLDVGALLEPPPAPAGGAAQIGPKDEARTAELMPKVVEAISTVFDPEIPVNIYELGLIYKIEADAESKVKVEMTLTSPACPSAQQLPSEVRYKVKALEGVSDAFVEVVWEPAWTKDLMSEDAKIGLGMF